MGFADKFVASVGSSNLMDDAFHSDLNALAASALAGDIGSLLCRVKYADGTINKLFEGNAGNLAQLLRIWEAEVTKKGRERKWVRIESERDILTAHALYRRVAAASLAHFLDGKCEACNGTGVALRSLRKCTVCDGAGDREVTCAGGYERERIKDMISEMESMATSHAGRASHLLGREH
jgi:hypothetical protein